MMIPYCRRGSGDTHVTLNVLEVVSCIMNSLGTPAGPRKVNDPILNYHTTHVHVFAENKLHVTIHVLVNQFYTQTIMMLLVHVFHVGQDSLVPNEQQDKHMYMYCICTCTL